MAKSEIQDSIFHVCNRGFEKSIIFDDSSDYQRFLETLYKCNNKTGALRTERKSFFEKPQKQDKLVHILKWALLPNHYHLLISEVEPGGAVEFVKRIGNSFTKYINIKKKRSGYLFQNSARIIEPARDAHHLYMPFYVDLNPLDLHQYDWKESGIRNSTEALKFLEEYPWSSYRDYTDAIERPAAGLLSKDVFFRLYETNQNNFQTELKDWISSERVLIA